MIILVGLLQEIENELVLQEIERLRGRCLVRSNSMLINMRLNSTGGLIADDSYPLRLALILKDNLLFDDTKSMGAIFQNSALT